MRRVIVVAAILLFASRADARQAPPAVATPGPVLRARSGAELRVLLAERAGPLDAVEIVELTLPPLPPEQAGEHRHTSAELIYVLSGSLDHVINGEANRLGPGGLGIVRPGDRVRHRVIGPDPVRALVIWTPAGELDRLRAVFAPSTGAAPLTASPEDELASLRSRWIAAYEAGDVAPLADLYTADATRMPYNGPGQVGRTAIVDAYRAAFESRRLTPDITLTAEEVSSGGDGIVERGRYRELLTPRAGGPVLVEQGKYVSLIRRENGRLRYHWSIFNPDAPASPLAAR